MKIIISVALVLLAAISLPAQDEFKKIWETKVSVPNKWNAQNADLSKILIGDLKEIEMVDGTNGKSLWKFNIKDKLGVKQMEDWSFLWAKEGEPVEIVYKKPKEDTKISVYLDSKTGQINSSFKELKDKEQKIKKNKSKIFFASDAYDEASDTEISLLYDSKFIAKHSGSEFDVLVVALGGHIWSKTIKVKAASHLNRLLLSKHEPNVMMNLMIAADKVFVIAEGISVLDLKTGNYLWGVSFDNVQSGMTSQEIGRSPLPVVDNGSVYYCDFTKGEKAIKKLDINSGNVIWTSDKLNNDDVVSQLGITNNVLIAKFGGYIRKAKNIYNPNNGLTSYKVSYEYEGKSDIRAYDATSGKPIWNAENISEDDKFAKSECSILLDKNKIIACTNKLFYILDPVKGTVIKQAPISFKEIGKPQNIFIHNESYIVEGEEGLASNDKTGEQNYAVSTGKRLMTEFRGNAFIVWTGKDVDDMNEFICFDLTSGKILGKLKGTYRPEFDTNGDYFIRFKDEQITKFKTY